MKADIKLKPCPFCGGEANIVKNKSGYYGVMCKNTVYCCIMPTAHDTEEKAAFMWNARRPLERIVDRLRDYAKYKGILRVSMSAPAENYVPISAVIQIVKSEVAK